MTLVSAVIGFRNWGLDRLALAMGGIHASLEGIEHEIVVCDYGSDDPEAVREAVEAASGVCVRVDDHGPWSRSKAVNAAVSASRGEIIVVTDADMLYAPGTLPAVTEALTENPNQVVLLQYRDLPPSHDADGMGKMKGKYDWPAIELISQVRPRWGMGGLAVARESWDRLRGFDERFHTYGAEDLDFGRRCQRMGLRMNWLDAPGVRTYHVWHPSSSAEAQRSDEDARAISVNRRILSDDHTWSRNQVDLGYLSGSLPPVVTVVFQEDGSKQTSPTQRIETLWSVLQQTVEDIEVLVPESWSDLAQLDPRIEAVSVTPRECADRGSFVLLAKPGDIWSKDRLENLLAKFTAGTGIVSDADFKEVLTQSGEVFVSTPEHHLFDPRTSGFRASLLLGLTANTTWDQILGAVASAGAEWRTVPRVGFFTPDTFETEEAADLDRRVLEQSSRLWVESAGVRAPVPEKPKAGMVNTLPRSDSLTGLASFRTDGNLEALMQLAEVVSEDGEEALTELSLVADLDGVGLRSSLRVFDLSYEAYLKALMLSASLGLSLSEVSTRSRSEGDDVRHLVEHWNEVYGDGKKCWWVVAVDPTSASASANSERLRQTPQVTVAFGRSVTTGDSETFISVGRVGSANPGDALKVAAGLSKSESVRLYEGKNAA